MSDARSGAQIAQEYGLGDPIPFTEAAFPKGSYVIGASGAVVRVIAWSMEVDGESAEQKDVCQVLRWKAGWSLHEIVENDDIAGGSSYAAPPTDINVIAGPGGSFKQTEGAAWLLTEKRLEELLGAPDSDEDDAPAEDSPPEIKVPALPSDDQKCPDEDNDATDDPPEDGGGDGDEPEASDKPAAEDNESTDVSEERVIESGLKTGPMPQPKGSPARAYTLYTLVHRFGPIRWDVLEAWAWEEKLFKKSVKARNQMRIKLNELIKDIYKDGYDLRRSYEHEVLECVHIGPLEEQAGAGCPEAAWATLSEYMEGVVGDAVTVVCALFPEFPGDTIRISMKVHVEGDSMTKRA